MADLRAAVAGVAAAASLALGTAPAPAATVDVQDGCLDTTGGCYVLRVVADPGEANDVHVSLTPSKVVVHDAGAPLKVGDLGVEGTAVGCSPVSPNEVECHELSSDHFGFDVGVELGDGDDRASVAGTTAEADTHQGTIFGGSGHDVIVGSPLPEEINGGPGADELSGRAGDDVLEDGDPDAQPSADRLDGGSGRDEASYDAADRRLRIDLAAGAMRSGGERDVLHSIEKATGGDGDDVLLGSARDEEFDGGLGRDVIRAGSGDDAVTATSKGRADRIDTGPGDDIVLPGVLDDGLRLASTLTCGPGRDTVLDPAPKVTLAGCERAGEGDTTLPYRPPYSWGYLLDVQPSAVGARSVRFDVTAGLNPFGTLRVSLRDARGSHVYGHGAVRLHSKARRHVTLRIPARLAAQLRSGSRVLTVVSALGRIPRRADLRHGFRARLHG